MATNRVLLYDPRDGLMFATDSDDQKTNERDRFQCKDITSFECFFRPISSCTFQDAITASSGSRMDFLLPSKAHEFNSKKVLMTTGEAFKKIPSVVKDSLIGRDHLIADKWTWWKAQAVAYLMRPNQRTLLELAMRRREVFTHSPSVMPKGTVSAHVRHGDKGLEMKLLPMRAYLTAATLLLDVFEGHATRPWSNNKAVFVSTEDPDAITTALSWAHKAHNTQTTENNPHIETDSWNIYYTDIPRSNLPLTGLVQKFGGVNEMLNGLLNLQLAVECDFWVCTLSSNWCGLIDELRSISAGKASHPYVDIGYPCFQGC